MIDAKSKTKKDVDTRIHNMCLLEMTTEEEMTRLGTSLLLTFRDVCRTSIENAEDKTERLCSVLMEHESPYDMVRRVNESMVWLEFFASEANRQKEEAEIERILHSEWMIHVMDSLKNKVFRFAEYGPEFVDILNVCYMNIFDYSEDEALEQLGMGRSTFFKKKKRAIILFGLAFREYQAEQRRFNELYIQNAEGIQMEMII